ncbi:BON domain-containing protein [Tundrisphaera lichenicola]|uniref:BON domain-containing protein n=1 Tax=Tundrisphaera lichenicola TaxID=2029860 RepID=UPI003EBC54A9
MKVSNRNIVAATLSAGLITWGCTAWAQQGPVGQGLNEAGRAVKRGLQTAGQAVQGGFQTAGQAVQGGFQKTRTSVHNMEVVSRVYSRLHWDKALTTSNIELTVQAGGIATLTGVVPDEEAKAKALMLTSETVGVIEVIDQLTVGTVVSPAPIVPGASPVIVAPAGTRVITPTPSNVPTPSPTDTPL